jgi:beta-glucosidase
VVLCLGEARQLSGEAASRAQPDLPGRQPELAQAVLDLGKPVAALLSSGRPLVARSLFERAQAVLATWFLGCEAGHAIGDVLSGRHNPTGRLPVSWPVDVGQIPIFYARRPTGRPPDPKVHYSSKYLDLPVEPQFPFGHGLSYARFELSGLRVSGTELRDGESVTIACDVVNRGPVAGEETVLLFVRDPLASVARPLLELKGMARIALEAGQEGTVRFTLTAADLMFLGADLSPRLEPGIVELYVGRSADQATALRTSIRIVDP